MTRGGGGVQTPPKKNDIIYEQPPTCYRDKSLAIAGRGKFTKITISLNSTKTKISYKTMKKV